MAKKLRTKRSKELAKLTEKGKIYSIQQAVQILKQVPKTKFDQSVELQFKLGVDVTASDLSS